VDGYIRASEISRDRVEDARTVLKEGEEVEAKFTGVDRKNRALMLSIKGKDFDEEKATIESYKSGGALAGSASLGDLLKDQLSASKDDGE
ncbi:S1 RNA-binding domain-containing protein, partial [Thiolapillus sp.]